jgi:orotate phosphoribosyltransferase
MILTGLRSIVGKGLYDIRAHPDDPRMQAYKGKFLDLAIELGVLQFGEFTLKSGRVSPYFFNAGLFNTGAAAAALGRCYAAAIVDHAIEFDMLFGPAYKGIPLVALTAAALAEHEGRNHAYAFNRKEAKDHGEGGNIIGARIAGRVLIVDDVITAGTAIGEAVDIIESAGGHVAGVIVALDRQERGKSDRLSAVQQVAGELGVPIRSIVTLTDLIEHVAARKTLANELGAIRAYRDRYGADFDNPG